MRLPKLTGAIGLACLVMACATPYQRPEEPAAWQPDPASCASSLEDVEAMPFPSSARQQRRIPFRDSATCLVSDSGEEPVLMYRLQALEVPSAVDLALHVGRTTVLAARVELLGADFRTIEMVPFDEFTQRGNSYTLRLYFNDPSDKADYLLIRPDPEVYGSEMKRIHGTAVTVPIVTPVAVGSITNGVESRKTLLFRDIGTFTLEVVEDDAEAGS